VPSASAACERPSDYLDLAVGRVLTAASFRRSVCTANNTPIAMSARVAPKLAGVMQVRQVPTISGAAYMAVFFVFAIHRWLPVLRESIHHFEVNDEPRAPEEARRHMRETRLRCAAQSFLLVRNWNISRMAVINQSTMYGVGHERDSDGGVRAGDHLGGELRILRVSVAAKTL
jgi:hypothetical protein